MAMPAFRFVETSDAPSPVEGEFWRDVDASDRLASFAASDLYLRDLCRTLAIEEFGAADGQERAQRERSLIDEVRARGYRVSSDTDRFS